MFPTKANLSLSFTCPNCLTEGSAHLINGKLDIIPSFHISKSFDKDGKLNSLELICPKCQIGIQVMIPTEISIKQNEPWYFLHTQYDNLIEFIEFETIEKLELYLFEFAVKQNIMHFPVNESIYDQVKHINRSISSSVSISKAQING